MYLDNPIKTIEEDKLKRTNFSKSLADAIYNYKYEDSFVIGICGKWGSGKTSVIKMTISELEKRIDNGMVIAEFSAWNYSSHNELIMQFFKTLKNSLGLKDGSKVKRVIGDLLNDYCTSFCLLSGIPHVGMPLSILAKPTTKIISKFLKKGESLEKIKEKLSNELSKYKKRVLIVIDDIDRLTATQIKEVFQLVNQVADLPNIMYILSMDREIVANILSEMQKCDGNEFLEKIIQVTYNVPEMDEGILKQLFLDKIKEVFEQDEYKEIEQNYLEDVYLKCIKPYLKNIRDLNRIANSLILKKGVLLGKVAVEDMVAMTSIELLEPKLYNWIYDNKEYICVGGSKVAEIDYGNNKTYEQKVIKDFKDLGIKNANVALEMVSRLFPTFAIETNREYDVNPSFVNRIGTIKVLESYYAMSIHMRGPVIAT